MTIFKQIPAEDRVSTRTLLHEAIPITGTILSGTYGGHVTASTNVKNFTHGMFQSVYDYPFLSSSANHIFDISLGTSANSALSVSSQATKKDNIYNQMAQVLAGYDKDGNIQRFDEDGDLTGGTKIDNCIFLNFSRLLVKDEIKKGSFQLTLGVNNAYATPFTKLINITDHEAATSFKVNSPAGEYGILYASSSTAGLLDPAAAQKVDIGGAPYWKAGLIYYQAGIAVLSSSILSATGTVGGKGILTGLGATKLDFKGDGTTLTGSIIANEISASADYLRNRIQNIQFNNTIELNSTVYFCRVKHNEFNYSANPTYLTGSQIRVKQDATDIPISYITSIGLYSADNQLLAVGKFSEPIRKDNNIELTFRARLDY
tara:strand:- start:2391 stop:3512 length:1122 start_codon:yes stop_codon:yes gene_type:complete